MKLLPNAILGFGAADATETTTAKKITMEVKIENFILYFS